MNHSDDILDSFSKRISKDQIVEYSPEISEVDALLAELEPAMQPEPGATMTERSFVLGGYVDMFYSLTKMDVKDGVNTNHFENPLFLEWYRYSRGNKEVAIVDEHGELLYLVPPMFSTNIIDNEKLQMVMPLLDNVKARMDKDNNYLPGDNIKFLKFLLSGFQQAATKPNTEICARWQTIFKRYIKEDGKAHLQDEEAITTTTQVDEEVKASQPAMRQVDADEWE